MLQHAFGCREEFICRDQNSAGIPTTTSSGRCCRCTPLLLPLIFFSGLVSHGLYHDFFEMFLDSHSTRYLTMFNAVRQSVAACFLAKTRCREGVSNVSSRAHGEAMSCYICYYYLEQLSDKMSSVLDVGRTKPEASAALEVHHGVQVGAVHRL